MKKIFTILTGTNGIFARHLELKHNNEVKDIFNRGVFGDVPYLNPQNDKFNLRNDMGNVFRDFNKTTKEVAVNLRCL